MNVRIKRLLAAFLLAGLPSGMLVVIPAWAAPAAVHEKKARAADQPVRFDAENVTIEMSLAEGFDPPSIEIKTGTTVTWHNIEPLDYPIVRGYHSVVEDNGAFESPEVAPGQRWSHTFLKPGTFNYHCGIHPLTMTGQVIVTGPPVKLEPDKVRVDIVEPDPNDEQSWGYKPADLTIETGTTVIWTNNGAQEHTVTADNGEFDSGEMARGDEFRFTFKKAGVFHYHCTPHPWMEAVVRVHEPGKAPPKDTHQEDDDTSGSPGTSSSTSGSGDGPTTHQVAIVEGSSTDDWGYDPSTLGVAVGDTVVWTNTGEIEHTVTADDGSFDSGNIAPGGTFEYTFTEEGDFAYHCEPHPFMVASITVSKTATGAGSGPGSGSAAGPTLGTEEEEGHVVEEPVPAEGAEDGGGKVGTEFVRTLSGKEASLGVVVMVLSTALAFLVGRWWGQAVARAGKAGVA